MRAAPTGLCLPILLGFTSPVFAAEGGTGWYLLGSKTELSGYLPPPGVYAQSLNYYYMARQRRFGDRRPDAFRGHRRG